MRSYLRLRCIQLLLLLPLAGLPTAQAQLFIYLAEITEIVADTSAKPMFAAIVEEYPDAELLHFRDRDTLVIVTAHMFAFEDLAALVEPNGFTLVSLDRDVYQLINDGGGPPFPVRSSQDPATEALHLNACMQWRSLHAERYHAALNATINRYRHAR